MAFIIRDADNVRESFTSPGTTITAAGAVANSRALSAVLSNGDTFFGVARKGAEFSAGIFTWSTGGSIAQTTVWYSTNGNAAVSFSSGSGEIFMDAPSRLFDELNLKEISVASATTCDIGAVHGGKIVISGTTTITGLGTTIDKRRFVRFSGALTLTHNATSLILPGGASITTAAGDTAAFMSDSSGNWRCMFYSRASGKPIVNPTREELAAVGVVKKQVFTSSGTYTPSTGMLCCIIECVGGGGGGGATVGSGTGGRGGGGGGSGSYSRKYATAADIGASKTVTIGALGAGGSAGANAGAAGGDTSVGTLCIGKGGGGGNYNDQSGGYGEGGAGGAAGTGDLTPAGSKGTPGFGASITTVVVAGGSGGGSFFQSNGLGSQALSGSNNAGGAAGGYGGGGGGAATCGVASNAAGGNGSAGIVIITEFCTE